MLQTDTERARYERWLELREYWTPEAMAAAIPVPTPSLAAGAEAPPPGPVGAFQTRLIQGPAYDPYYRRAGKLFFMVEDLRYSASASAINDNGIMTAAHNLFNVRTRSYVENAVYVPGYQYAEPLGFWELIGELFVPVNWKSTFAPRWDYGFSRVAKGGLDGKTVLGKVTGHFKLAVNLLNAQQWDCLAYPAVPRPGYAFNGEQMWSCQGTYTRIWDKFSIGKSGNLTWGASGGPWVIPGTEYVNGVHSWSDPVFPDENFSPVFDGDVLFLYEKTFPPRG